MAFDDAGLHRSPSSVYLGSLLLPCLRKHREEHNSPSRDNVVRDPYLPASEVKAQLPQLAPQLASEGLPEVDAFIGKQVDIAFDLAEVVVRERQQPVLDLWLKFNRTPGHSANAIPTLRLPAWGGRG